MMTKGLWPLKEKKHKSMTSRMKKYGLFVNRGKSTTLWMTDTMMPHDILLELEITLLSFASTRCRLAGITGTGVRGFH